MAAFGFLNINCDASSQEADKKRVAAIARDYGGATVRVKLKAVPSCMSPEEAELAALKEGFQLGRAPNKKDIVFETDAFKVVEDLQCSKNRCEGCRKTFKIAGDYLPGNKNGGLMWLEQRLTHLQIWSLDLLLEVRPVCVYWMSFPDLYMHGPCFFMKEKIYCNILAYPS